MGFISDGGVSRDLSTKLADAQYAIDQLEKNLASTKERLDVATSHIGALSMSYEQANSEKESDTATIRELSLEINKICEENKKLREDLQLNVNLLGEHKMLLTLARVKIKNIRNFMNYIDEHKKWFVRKSYVINQIKQMLDA
jgi:chromosome segregation ATPase